MYETIIHTSKKKNKLPMMATYLIYHSLIKKELHLPNINSFISSHQSLFDTCSIEAMVVSLFTEDKWSWTASECERVFLNYKKKSYNQDALKIPPPFESTIILQLANSFLEIDGDSLKFTQYIMTAINELSGKGEAQAKLKQYLGSPAVVDVNHIYSTFSKTSG